MVDATMAPLAVVVVNYGSSALLDSNLLALSRAVPDATIVVVDNLSTEQERARVGELARREGWALELPGSNLGFGAGMNLGVERARAEGATTFLLLNPDATLDAASLYRLRRRSQQAPLALLSPRVTRPDGSPWFSGADLYLDEGRLRSPRRRAEHPGARREAWLSGACLLVTAELWGLVGGFAEEYFLYWEDVDLSHRVLAAGGTLEVVDDAVAAHAEGGTQGGEGGAGEPKSATYYFYNIRNRMLFARRNLGPAEQRAWARLIVPVAWETLMQGGRRQLLRSPGLAISALRGVRAARRIARAAAAKLGA